MPTFLFFFFFDGAGGEVVATNPRGSMLSARHVRRAMRR